MAAFFRALLTIDKTVGEVTAINLFADGFAMKDIVTQPSEDNHFALVASSGDGKAQVSLVFVVSWSDYTLRRSLAGQSV